MALTPTTRLGPYEIVAPIGAGGMGEVYRAKDTRLEREVAIKVLPQHLSRSPEFKQRFEREAKSISQLAHSNICTLYDVGHHDGVDYLVMELLEGETLAQRLTKGALPLEQVLRHGVEVASALDAAHRKGVVHRDLKPGNVMLTKSGAKLLDFGLAKSTTVLESDPSAVTVSQPLTSKGTILGTFQYMAPEQLEGREADARTDVFAFGAVLYEMATGKRAFDGASRASLIASIMSSQPRPISELQPLTPPALDRLIRKCLAKDPDSRWQSASDVADELRWVAEGGSQVGFQAAIRSKSPLPWMSVAILGAAIIVATLVLVIRPASTPGPLTHLSVSLPPTDTVDAGLENLVMAVSPDGRTIAYCAQRDGVIRLYVRRLDQREPTVLPGTEDAYDPFFSPDGKWVAFFAGLKLKKISVQGGAAIDVCDAGSGRSGVWLADDTIVLAPSFGTPLMRVPAVGGVPEPLTRLDGSKRERTHRWPDAVDGTEWVIFTVGTEDSPGGYDDSNIEAVSLKTGERRVLVKGGSMARYAASGHLVFSQHGVLFAILLDLTQMKTIGRPVPILDSVAGETTSGAVHFDIARNGTLVYASGLPEGLDQELVWVDRNGQVEVVAAPPRPYRLPHVSPDGKQVLLGIGPGLGKGDTWRWDLEREKLSRLTFDDRSIDAFWLPDQRRIIVGVEAPDQMLVLTIDGSLPPRVVYESSTPFIISGITPDGQSVLLSHYGAADSDVFLVPLEGDGKAQTLIAERRQQFGGVVSPDGRWIAYRSSEDGPSEVYVRHFQGGSGKWQVSEGGGVAPLWSPDGKELYYVNGVSMMSVLVTSDDTGLSTATPKKLFNLPSGRRYETSIRPYDISPDGKRFLFTRTSQPGLERRQINVVLNWFEELKAKAPVPK